MRGKITSALVALLARRGGWGAGGASVNAQAEPLKIRGAWVAPLANWSSVWLQKKDLATHFGQSYVFEPVRYAGTPPMITAIAIGNAGLDDIRVITDDFQDGNPGYYSNEFDVLKDGPVKKIEDLKGKV